MGKYKNREIMIRVHRALCEVKQASIRMDELWYEYNALFDFFGV